MVDDAIFAARQTEILLYGDFQKRMKIHLYTDPEATMESIASSKYIEQKMLRLTITDLKERLLKVILLPTPGCQLEICMLTY